MTPLKIARTAASKTQLPKTKKPFAAWLATLPPNKRFNPGSRGLCPLAAFMEARHPKCDVWMDTTEYQINHVWRDTPDWANKFQTDAMYTPGRTSGDSLTVAKLRKILEAVA